MIPLRKVISDLKTIAESLRSSRPELADSAEEAAERLQGLLDHDSSPGSWTGDR